MWSLKVTWVNIGSHVSYSMRITQRLRIPMSRSHEWVRMHPWETLPVPEHVDYDRANDTSTDADSA